MEVSQLLSHELFRRVSFAISKASLMHMNPWQYGIYDRKPSGRLFLSSCWVNMVRDHAWSCPEVYLQKGHRDILHLAG